MNLRRGGMTVLAAVLLLAASPVWAGNGQNLLQYVPQNSAIVVSVNLEQIRSLPLYQLVWGVIMSNPEAQEALQQMQTEAGFDPNTDLSGFVMTLSPDDNDHWAMLVEGNFDVARITTFLGTQDQTEMATQEYQGRTVYYDPSEAEGTRGYFSFLGDNIVAAGTQAELSAVLDTAAGAGAGVATHAQMSGLLSSVDTSGAFWFAGSLSPAMQAEMAGSPMEGVSTMYGSGNFNSGFNFNYVLGTTTAEQATAFAAFIQEQIAQARSAPEMAQMGLTSVLDAVSVAATGTSVSLSAAIPEQTMNQLIGIISALMAAQAGQGMPQ